MKLELTKAEAEMLAEAATFYVESRDADPGFDGEHPDRQLLDSGVRKLNDLIMCASGDPDKEI